MMSDYDDYSSNSSGSTYGGFSLSEALATPSLAEAYGLESHRDDIMPDDHGGDSVNLTWAHFRWVIFWLIVPVVVLAIIQEFTRGMWS